MKKDKIKLISLDMSTLELYVMRLSGPLMMAIGGFFFIKIAQSHLGLRAFLSSLVMLVVGLAFTFYGFDPSKSKEDDSDE